ncbi:unnamed protein product [Sphagnum jensenii]|uniref:Uncharacterized protein n=1 Tax=Sphagnum jensenii TaxID=128206 RepID=A0ABP0WRR4_9BRYO
MFVCLSDFAPFVLPNLVPRLSLWHYRSRRVIYGGRQNSSVGGVSAYKTNNVAEFLTVLRTIRNSISSCAQRV